MGQAVSYILKCVCCEAEDEERSNEQNLLSCPLISNSYSNSWIDSSSANNVARHQFLFNHSTIQVSDEKAQFCNQRRSSCIDSSNIDQTLQPDNLLVAPPSLVLSIDPSISSSSTCGTLLHEVFDDNLNDFPSIVWSTDEANELSIDPSTDVPCMDMSNDQALVHELFIDPSSTDVPCMGMINDQPLVHELFIDPSSTDVPSINTSNDQALAHELSVDPSIDVPCIDSSTNEAFVPKLVFTRAGFRIFPQFKVTDLNSQVVENKSQVHSPKKQRKLIWARKEAAVVIERKKKHYSSSCIDSSNINQTLQPDNLLVAPPSLVLSIDPSISSSSTCGTLLHEVFDDNLNDFPSIDWSTDEANELSIDPLTDVPCMDMSNDQALVLEPFIDPSLTDVPSINTSNDQPLVHELFIDPSSTDVPSINTSNDQALVHELSVDPSIDVPCINSSTNEAFVPKLVFTRAGFRIFPQFKVTDLNSQVLEDKSQVHSPKKRRKRKGAKARKEAAVVIERKIKHYSSSCIDSSNIDQTLQPDNLLVAPPSLVLSIDPSISSSSTCGTLLHEVFDDNLNDFPSIDWSTDEAHELSIDPSTDVPWMDMSNDQALVHELFIDPSSTDVPSINSSNDQALVHELFIDPSSTDVPSINTNNDQALVHELSVDPSIDVTSIDSSTNEAFVPKLVFTRAGFRILPQFKVTDLNTQVVEDKSQFHSPKKQRKRKGAKARKEAAVVIERKIKHYSSLQKILLVGEGDFSFSACLARSFGSASNIVATSLDSTEFLKANYKNAVSNICELKSRGAKVMHGVDATGMACNCLLNGSVYDRIIYNFPLVGFFPNESRRMQLKHNRRLILKYLENAKKLISADGEIHISHKSYGFFLEWKLPVLASNVGLRLIEEVPFNLKDYRGYNTKFGFGGDENFNCNPSKTYKFGHKLKN